ncbi:hypothetical protein [Flavobacterium sp. UMI-01]|uniref:hypothetical protein n=1 Tax=Flavobacterium sp. UMI-01 TaxID=1441053 RepID=UPI001C7D95FD|nr:hypothetical protein [Flavobacterium sp. UMI-01]GIZ08338.1 hypothetical protein FUMI01_10650 [Flavobacterium sp. UMI-01]
MAKEKKKKKSTIFHSTYNKKEFLAPNSIRSMAAVHAKILKDGTAVLRISDCNTSVRIWNDFNDLEEKKEMLTKVDNLIANLQDFRMDIKSRIV